MAATKPIVIVVVPTYNEKENISRLIKVLFDEVFPDLVKQYSLGVLVVDDTSPDGTADEVRKLQAVHETLHLLVNKNKAGLGNAYIKGMKHALDALRADVLFEMDADLSHDPKKLLEMLHELEKGVDLVLGSRYMKGGSIPQNWGWHRKLLSFMGNWIIRIVITNFSVRDWTTGYRGIRKEVVEAVLPELSRDAFMGYTFQIGFLHKTIRKDFVVAEVPIDFIDREIGESKLGVEYITNTLYYILGVRFKELVSYRFTKFAAVGFIGAVVQFASLWLFRQSLPFQVAFFLSVEMAVISNFIWSNIWTFQDRQLQLSQLPLKFVQFNLASAGSVILQEIVAIGGYYTIGLKPVGSFLGFGVDTGVMFAVVGIILGMFWNFFAYTTFIWTKGHVRTQTK